MIWQQDNHEMFTVDTTVVTLNGGVRATVKWGFMHSKAM